MFRTRLAAASRRRYVLGAGGLAGAGSLALTTNTSSPSSSQKLSIYPAETTLVLLEDEPSSFEQQIGQVRRTAVQQYRAAYEYVHDGVSWWIGVEERVERRLKSLKSPSESLTPGILYVGIATLSGSIIARNRSFITRGLLPPTLLLISAHYFLPCTTANVRTYAEELESRYLPPRFREVRETGVAHSKMAVARSVDATTNARESLGRGLESAVHTAQGWSGLRLREALGWAGEEAKEAEGLLKRAEVEGEGLVRAAREKAKEVVEKTGEKAKEVAGKAEKYVGEKKDDVKSASRKV